METEENDTEEEPAGLAPLDDGSGRVACLKCSKILKGGMGNARKHFLIKHVVDPKNKNIKCKFGGCEKRFAVMEYMRRHVKVAHGVSFKMLGKSVKPVFKKEQFEQSSDEE